MNYYYYLLSFFNSDGQMDSFDVSTLSLANVYVPAGVEISATDGAIKAPPTLELDEANDSEKEGNLNLGSYNVVSKMI